MSGTERAEIYFISAMMILILILCVAAVYIFIRQYKKEMQDRQEKKSRDEIAAGKTVENGS